MAELEAEAMLLGIWKNFTELEENMNLDELNLLLKAHHRQERDRQRFAAALKGVKIDNDADERFEAVKKRAAARLRGEEVEEKQEEKDKPMSAEELSAFGIKYA